MAEENMNPCSDPQKTKVHHHNHGNVCGGIYGLGFLGAAIYFIQHAPTFGAGVLGFLKAIVWPVLLIYKLLEFFKM